ncbi:MAG TPA: FHA domain-containing protein [Streptosporangiaceae bacterium]|nr:FHA domain-containing protein [Streptosporangiaceae bacterium]
MSTYHADIPEDDVASLTCPACGAEVGKDDLICFTCGANLPRRNQGDEPATPPTVMQEHLRREGLPAPAAGPSSCPHCGAVVRDPATVFCVVCREPLPPRAGIISPVVLRLTFPTGNVEVPAGTSLVLGRDPGESLVAAAFAQFDNVSRKHATVTVSDNGEATIRDEHSTNGTFVNGDRVLPGTEVRLADGDSVRLAADVSADVSLPSPRPVPGAFSRNGHRGPG